ncbi:MAG TPA: hypothetical protein VJ828_00180 [Lacipirellulaceae bacterium]|nr:hypothetical protein [Lacipirellulaceae bacterium]
MYWLMLASRILHILGAIILLGGLFYLRTVITSVALPLREEQGEGSSAADYQFGGRRAVWAMWTGIASLFLLVTGLWNFFQFIKTYDLSPSYHMLVGLKILTGLALFVVAAILAGRSAAAEKLRQNMRLWLNVCIVLGIITVAFGSVLRTFPHNPKVDAPNGPQLIAPAD